MAFREAVTVQFGADVSAFNQGVQQMQQSTDRLAGAIEHRLLGARHVIGALFAGFGLGGGLESLADRIAAAIVGGTKKGFEEAEKSEEEFANAFERHLKHTLTKPDLLIHLQKELSEASAEAASPMKGTWNKENNSFKPSESHTEFIKRTRDAATRVLQLTDEITDLKKGMADDSTKEVEKLVKAAQELGKEMSDEAKKEAKDAEERAKWMHDAQSELTKEWEKQQKITEELEKQNALLTERKEDLAQAQRDMFLPSLSQLAGSRGPHSGMARQAERYERMARERSGFVAPNGEATESERFSSRAMTLRNQLSGSIKSADSDPFKSMEKGISAIEKHTADTASALRPASASQK